MGERAARGREPSRRRGTTEQRTEQLDWSQFEPFEEGRAGDLPNDDKALFGDFASQLLEGRRRWHQRDVYQSELLCSLGIGRRAASNFLALGLQRDQHCGNLVLLPFLSSSDTILFVTFDEGLVVSEKVTDCCADAERLTPPQALQQQSRQLRLRGAGHESTQNEPLRRHDSPGAGQPRQGPPSRFTGRSRSSSGTSSSLQEGHRISADAALDAG